MHFADTLDNRCQPALPVPQVRSCFFEEVLEPRLSGMDLDWNSPAAEEPATWRLPQGVVFRGPAPVRFGIHVRRLGPDHYSIHLIWDQVHLAFKDLTRRQVRESCLGPLLARLGTDLEYLLDQPSELPQTLRLPRGGLTHAFSGPSPPRRTCPMPTLFTVTIDTEEEWDWGAGWPTSRLSVTNVPHLTAFQDLCDGYQVATTYFTNRAVLDDPAARKALLALAKRERVEIGMHIHPWNTPPLADGPVRARDTYLHNHPDAIIRAKLESVYDRFRDEGLRPTSFRGGRFSCGPVVQDFLRDKGFVAEASVVPFTSWPDEGAPDYRERDLLPRRLPPRRAGERALWEIPSTLAWTRQPHHFWRRCYASLERSWLRHLRLIGLAERAGLVRRVWLNFETTPAADMIALLQALRPLRLPCVCFLVHSSSLTAGPGPYCRSRADQERTFARIKHVFKALSGWDDFRPATVTEVANQLESQHHASPGYQPA